MPQEFFVVLSVAEVTRRLKTFAPLPAETAALEDPNPDVFLTAVRDVARARGMAQLAKDAGLGRESLYKALTPGAKPRYDTVLKLLNALGVRLSATPVQS